MFDNFEDPTKHISTAIPIKVGHKLLNENDNKFEKFIKQISIKFGKLQIYGYHTHFRRLPQL
jgi:hypothetical protein